MTNKEIKNKLQRGLALTIKESWDLYEYIKALEQTRWIPVSERLPTSDEEYHMFWVTDSKGNVTISKFYLSLVDRKPYWSGMIDVIAWMPLPTPYKEDNINAK